MQGQQPLASLAACPPAVLATTQTADRSSLLESRAFMLQSFCLDHLLLGEEVLLLWLVQSLTDF